ncbi:MAG TPA: MBL fold metallo-hydrolase [Ottowia sp.]|uniref:MBL fold metallo-hydrolase n=1 Tax=Ottowia sp. TaxID=1898956 RepID=UPI002CDA1F27|nr:MBL fold metallo-hydrolase [Ottowia sp.]HMN22184.1 MBL fold metallo-hydrolase [Ottowia sp.]
MEHRVFGSVEVHLGEKSGKYPDGNQVIVQGADLRVAFDTPQVARHLGAALERVELIILGHVHEDHMVALGRLARARVQVHEADLAAAQSWSGLARHYGYPEAVLAQLRPMIEREFDYQPRPDATAYVDGSVWELGGGVRIRAHHLPGHTAGHCALVVENEGLAFIGDIDLTGFGPYYGDASSDLGQFRRSLARIKALDARIWVTSHHRGVLTDRSEFLQALERFRAKLDERSERLLGYLRERPQTLDELVERRLLYPPGFELPYVPSAERRSIALHLAELQADGAVRCEADGRYCLAH